MLRDVTKVLRVNEFKRQKVHPKVEGVSDVILAQFVSDIEKGASSIRENVMYMIPFVLLLLIASFARPVLSFAKFQIC